MRDLLDSLEPKEMLLDAGFAAHPTGRVALLVTDRRVIWRLIEPAASPVRILAFDDASFILEFQPDDPGLRQIVIDRARERRRAEISNQSEGRAGP
ncbi:MAG TPA: hypothetical protein VLX59_19955 [Acidimicrobiales bacterium]|nr:hypothetical protein [Acidimicrobiales bacterium]